MSKNTLRRTLTAVAASALVVLPTLSLASNAAAVSLDRSTLTRPMPLPANLDPQPVTGPAISAPEGGFQAVVPISLDLTGLDQPVEICDPSGDFECVVPLSAGLISIEEAPAVCDPSGDFECAVALTDDGELSGIYYADEDGNIVPAPIRYEGDIDRSGLTREAGLLPISAEPATGLPAGAVAALSLAGAAVLTGGAYLVVKTKFARA